MKEMENKPKDLNIPQDNKIDAHGTKAVSMTIGEPRPITFKVDGISIRKFFNEKFVEILEKEFKTIKFEHLCINVMEKEDEIDKVKDKFIIGHTSPKDEIKEIITMGTRTPEHSKTLFELIKKFIEEKD